MYFFPRESVLRIPLQRKQAGPYFPLKAKYFLLASKKKTKRNETKDAEIYRKQKE